MNNDKIALLENTMEVKTRTDGTTFTCFSDSAPEELKELFLASYNVRDLDYVIFSRAIDTIVEAWEYTKESPETLTDYVEENYNDFASVYNAERLSYLNIFNDEDICDIVKEYATENVSTACAIWYDAAVHSAISLIISNYLEL